MMEYSYLGRQIPPQWRSTVHEYSGAYPRSCCQWAADYCSLWLIVISVHILFRLLASKTFPHYNICYLQRRWKCINLSFSKHKLRHDPLKMASCHSQVEKSWALFTHQPATQLLDQLNSVWLSLLPLFSKQSFQACFSFFPFVSPLLPILPWQHRYTLNPMNSFSLSDPVNKISESLESWSVNIELQCIPSVIHLLA